MDRYFQGKGQNKGLRLSSMCTAVPRSLQQKSVKLPTMTDCRVYGLEACLSVKSKNICSARPLMKIIKLGGDSARHHIDRANCLHSPSSAGKRISPIQIGKTRLHVQDRNITAGQRNTRSVKKYICVTKYLSEPIGKNGVIKHAAKGPAADSSSRAVVPVIRTMNHNDSIGISITKPRSEDSKSLTKEYKESLNPCVKLLKNHSFYSGWQPGQRKSTTGNTSESELELRNKAARRTHGLYKEIASGENDEITKCISRTRESQLQIRSKTAVGPRSHRSAQLTSRIAKSAGHERCRTALENHEVNEASIITLVERLDTFLLQENFDKFQSLLLSWTIEIRQRVVNYKGDSAHMASLFFRACQFSRTTFVLLMLERCKPDLEQTGVYVIPNDDAFLQVTPLWHAAAMGSLEIIRLLTLFGADVNASSPTGTSAVKAACCMSHVAVVSFLIAHDANIHTKSFNGVSCLMNAIHSLELTKLLAHHGAKIHEADLQGNTALHYAAEAGRLDTVKLLVEMGANPLSINTERCNVIETAAKFRRKHIVEYLLAVSNPRIDVIVNAYLVLAATTIVIDSEYFNGVCYWQKAINLEKIKRGDSLNISRKSVLGESLRIQEAFTAEELVRNSCDHDALCIQALLMYERLRGPLDNSYLNLLVYRGAVSADEKKLRLAVNLWKSAYQLYMKKYVDSDSDKAQKDVFNFSILKTLKYLVKIVYHISQILTTGNYRDYNTEQLLFPEAAFRELFGLVGHHVLVATRSSAIEGNASSKQFHFLIAMCICLFHTYLQLYTPEKRSPHFGRQLQDLIYLDPRGEHQEPLLQMCLTLKTFDVINNGLNASGSPPGPSHTMVEILMLLGADPVGRDKSGNTVLHQAVQWHNQTRTLDPSTLKRILRLGAHADQLNSKGQTACDLLPSNDQLRLILREVSLQCLAARAIASNRIPYVGEVPKSLYSFIELHSECSLVT